MMGLDSVTMMEAARWLTVAVGGGVGARIGRLGGVS